MLAWTAAWWMLLGIIVGHAPGSPVRVLATGALYWSSGFVSARILYNRALPEGASTEQKQPKTKSIEANS